MQTSKRNTNKMDIDDTELSSGTFAKNKNKNGQYCYYIDGKKICKKRGEIQVAMITNYLIPNNDFKQKLN